MKNLTLGNIALACGGTYLGPDSMADTEITAVTTDSRKVPRGALFAAIKGERVDGHKFIRMAHEKGAYACLVEEGPEEIADLLTASEDRDQSARVRKDVLKSLQQFPLIRVASTGKALMNLAEYYLRQLSLPVIGIIGSVGKTSTKEMVASVLNQKYRVLKTEGNFNNELGLPLTIFRLTEEDQVAVLEMGIDDFGQMRQLAKIARPTTVVMTNIGTCHLDHLKDRNGVWRAKSEVFDYVKKGGSAVFNGDDDKLAPVHEIRGIQPVHYGLSPLAADGKLNDLWADEIEENGFEGSTCTFHIRTAGDGRATGNQDDLIEAVEGREDKKNPAEAEVKTMRVHIPMPGRHMILNALAGAAVGQIYGLTLDQIKDGIEKAEAISGRFHIIKGEKYTVIDDCYNANPMSMKASLSVLASDHNSDHNSEHSSDYSSDHSSDHRTDDNASQGDKATSSRKVAILGDMGELGADEAKLHAEVGEAAAKLDLDAVYCAGPLSRNIVKAIEKAQDEAQEERRDREGAGTGQFHRIETRWYPNREALQDDLTKLVKPSDTILVKASHFMQFGEILKQLDAMQGDQEKAMQTDN